jgi:Kdo2-lipid A phosphotransferase
MDILEKKWRIKTLLLCNILALLIISSWLYGPTRVLWDRLDAGLFYLLNGSLSIGPVWRAWWAIANWRPFDLIAGGVLLFFVVRWLKAAPVGELKTRMAAFFMFVLVVLATNLTFQLILQSLEYTRISPSGVLQGAIRLQHEVSWINTKDYSGHSFPADHAFVLIAATLFFWTLGSGSMGRLCAVLFSPFLIPRLVSGGHWLTDILIGSSIMALVALSWWFATPAHTIATRWVARVLDRPLSWGESVLKHLNIV